MDSSKFTIKGRYPTVLINCMIKFVKANNKLFVIKSHVYSLCEICM